MSHPITKVTCVGAGLIGSGWAAHFMRAGLDVTVQGKSSGREAFLREALEKAMPALEELGLASGASPSRVKFTTDLQEALRDCQFVQESATEDVDAKTSLIAQIDALTPPEVVIASSSSGFLAADLRRKARFGNRIIIGHPFNPPYLVPLVELAGGDVAGKSVAVAADFYRMTGCEVVELTREIHGYIGNRIQLAVFREILYLLSQGVADLEAIDKAIAAGPAIRWAVMGPSSVFYLGARDPSLYQDFVELLARELDSGYTAPPSFEPDKALIKAYADEVCQSIGCRGRINMIALRNEGLAKIRVLLEDLRRSDGSAR
ncbi:3-hydroxyacyl-CoA dehydrogenase NAD-binding domain-containing protein [Sinorhizobium sp. 7-81]|uniref:3-hydroxyacyl-CoA dehydrogenase NAD-binding domain-containing protein n=1 Tax=Sinorhizobium sp. 8-89 TaxID=3049089 RepID=UPI0024C3E9BE|nr:3-hydroxyacyl-CoA dehydrogenase NAD-binding domain-containing protein [Sinorhizobium sp. 8-89]MDK1492916.1 3-hydroxyacyl-CoA dehydrogenase NAD-binding domain-containing protein [Sinorhizobium sp. 8-89]